MYIDNDNEGIVINRKNWHARFLQKNQLVAEMSFLTVSAPILDNVPSGVLLGIVSQIYKLTHTALDTGDGVWFNFSESTTDALLQFFNTPGNHGLELAELISRYYDRIQLEETRDVVRKLLGRLILTRRVVPTMTGREIVRLLEESIRTDDITRVPWSDARDARHVGVDPDSDILLEDDDVAGLPVAGDGDEQQLQQYQDIQESQQMIPEDWPHDAQPQYFYGAAQEVPLTQIKEEETQGYQTPPPVRSHRRRWQTTTSSDEDDYDLLNNRPMPRSPAKKRAVSRIDTQSKFKLENSDEDDESKWYNSPTTYNIYAPAERDVKYGTVLQTTQTASRLLKITSLR